MEEKEPDELGAGTLAALRLYGLLAVGFAGFWIGAIAHVILR